MSSGGTAASRARQEAESDRLAVLERDLAGFQGEVRTQISGLRDALTVLTGEMRNLASRVTRPANLGWIFGGVATLVALTAWLVRMGAAPHLDNLAELRMASQRMQEAAVSAAYSRGRIEEGREHVSTQVASLLGRVAELEDEDYDRAEAGRDLDPIRAQLLELRQRLQDHEMAPGHGFTIARVDALERIVEALAARVARVETAIADGAQIGARVDALQRAVEQLRSDVVAWRASEAQAGR